MNRIAKTTDSDYYAFCRYARKVDKLVFINGCFDIVHLGHLRMINYAKKLFHESCRLVIGINSDTSVYKMNKSHPLIFGEDYRAKFLDELCFGVIIFDEDTPNRVIMDLKPDVIVKGIDYQGKALPEQEVIDLLNIDVKYFDSRVKMSTTQIIQLVKERG